MQVNIVGFFDRIYIINLIERTDRSDEMKIQLRRIGVDFPNDKIEFFPAIRPQAAGDFESIGAKGCFLSHLNVLDNAVRRRFQRILICEDDLNFSRDFDGRIDKVLAELRQRQWAFFYGGYRVNGVGAQHGRDYVVTVPAAQVVETAHFLAIQGDAIASAQRYLSAMLGRTAGDPNGGPMHVDGAYSWFRRAHPQFKTLIAVPELGYQRPSRSDIYSLAWYDRLPIAATTLGYCRLFKSRIKQLFK
jgi:glycosyl transferase family 25